MTKSALFSLFVLGQAAALLAAGVATLYCSGDLMVFLIHLVGEEYALGAGNVIRTEDGGVLLTNPMGMLRWTMPFLILGILQITTAATLVWLWLRSRSTRPD